MWRRPSACAITVLAFNMFSNKFRREAAGAFSAFFLLSSALPLNAREPVRTRHAMVVASEPAEQAGVEILRKGGNAIDAAVAVGFALNAAFPFAGALGGGGFMTIRLADGTTNFIDFREEAPSKATRTMYLDANGNATRESTTGWKSSGVLSCTEA